MNYYSTDSINVIVLAGGINQIPLFDGYAPGYKALLPVGGTPLIGYTLQALRGTPRIRDICIVGPAEKIRKAVSAPERYGYLEGGKSLIENIRAGLQYFRDSEIVLVVTSDLPLATPEAIIDFLDSCSRADTHYRANIMWSMVAEKHLTGPYERLKKKGLNRFRDISVCHGNLLLLTPKLLENAAFVAKIDSIYRARKSSIRVALAIGPLLGFSYIVGVHLFGVLSINAFARLASASFTVGIVPILSRYPEIAADIDEARDYRFIIEELGRREGAGDGSQADQRRPGPQGNSLAA